MAPGNPRCTLGCGHTAPTSASNFTWPLPCLYLCALSSPHQDNSHWVKAHLNPGWPPPNQLQRQRHYFQTRSHSEGPGGPELEGHYSDHYTEHVSTSLRKPAPAWRAWQAAESFLSPPSNSLILLFLQQCPMVGWSCSRDFLSGQTVCLNCQEKSAGLLYMRAETQEPRTPEFTPDWPCHMTDLLSDPAHSQTQSPATLSAPDLQLCPGCKTSLTPWDNDFLSWSFPNSHRDLAQGYHRLIPCHSSWKASLSLIPECALLLQCSRLPIHSARTFKLYPLYTGKWNSSRLRWWYRSYLITTLQRGHIGWHSFFKMVWPSQSWVLSWGWGQYVFGGFNKPLTSKSF